MKTKIIPFLFSICIALPAYSQEDSISNNINPKDNTAGMHRIPIFDKHGQVDLIDIGNGVLNKYPNRSADTTRIDVGKLHNSLLPGLGYSLQTNFEIELTYLGGFYTSKNSNQSSIEATAIYTQRRQLLIPMLANIWTRDNKYNIIGDWRYLLYPQNTYGLGGYTSLHRVYILDYTNVRLYSTIYKPVRPDMYVGIGYDLDYLFNISEKSPPGVLTDFQRYNMINHQNSSTAVASAPTLNFLLDTRRNSIDPQGGYYVNMSYRPNFTFLSSSQYWQSLVIDLRKYISLSSNSKSVLAFWSYEWLTLDGTPPYILLPYTGGDPYSNTGRGFAEGRYRGRNMLYLEGEYRFDIMRNGLIGGIIFSNTESFSEQTNDEFARVSAAVGAGVRIKFNKFSKTNVAFDYAFGSDGSKGIFLNLGEVF